MVVRTPLANHNVFQLTPELGRTLPRCWRSSTVLSHLLTGGAVPAGRAGDLAQRLANIEPRVADEAARAEHARHLVVARDGGRAGHAAHLSLRLDAHGGRDAAQRAADAAERRRALLAAELHLQAASGFARHAPDASIPAEAAGVGAAARVRDNDRVVVQRVAVAAHRWSCYAGNLVPDTFSRWAPCASSQTGLS